MRWLAGSIKNFVNENIIFNGHCVSFILFFLEMEILVTARTGLNLTTFWLLWLYYGKWYCWIIRVPQFPGSPSSANKSQDERILGDTILRTVPSATTFRKFFLFPGKEALHKMSTDKSKLVRHFNFLISGPDHYSHGCLSVLPNSLPMLHWVSSVRKRQCLSSFVSYFVSCSTHPN